MNSFYGNSNQIKTQLDLFNNNLIQLKNSEIIWWNLIENTFDKNKFLELINNHNLNLKKIETNFNQILKYKNVYENKSFFEQFNLIIKILKFENNLLNNYLQIESIPSKEILISIFNILKEKNENISKLSSTIDKLILIIKEVKIINKIEKVEEKPKQKNIEIKTDSEEEENHKQKNIEAKIELKKEEEEIITENKDSKILDVEKIINSNKNSNEFTDLFELIKEKNDFHVLNAQKRNLMHLASISNQKKICEKLIKMDVNFLTIKDEQLDTPLHLATINKFEDLAIYLFKKNPKMAGIKNEEGWTPIYLAVFNNLKELIKQILEINPNALNITDKYGWTPLHLAAENSNLEICELFLNINADLALVQDLNGWTPLHIACKNKNEQLAVDIARHNHNSMLIKNNDGKTAYDIAKEKN